MRITKHELTGNEKDGIISGIIHKIEYSSIYESMEDLKDFDEVKSRMSNARGGDSWMTGEYGSASLEMIENGNSEFEIPTAIKDKNIMVNGRGVKRRKRYNDTDGSVDVMRVLGGSMTPFVRKTKIDSRGRNKKIVISLSASSTQSTESIGEFCKQSIEFCYKEAMKGAMVDVYVCLFSRSAYSNGNHCLLMIKLKDKREPFDYKRLSTMIYPAFYRTYCLNAMNGNRMTISSDYGQVVKVKHTRAVIEHLTPHEDSIILDYKEWNENKNRQL